MPSRNLVRVTYETISQSGRVVETSTFAGRTMAEAQRKRETAIREGRAETWRPKFVGRAKEQPKVTYEEVKKESVEEPTEVIEKIKSEKEKFESAKEKLKQREKTIKRVGIVADVSNLREKEKIAEKSRKEYERELAEYERIREKYEKELDKFSHLKTVDEQGNVTYRIPSTLPQNVGVRLRSILSEYSKEQKKQLSILQQKLEEAKSNIEEYNRMVREYNEAIKERKEIVGESKVEKEGIGIKRIEAGEKIPYEGRGIFEAFIRKPMKSAKETIEIVSAAAARGYEEGKRIAEAAFTAPEFVERVIGENIGKRIFGKRKEQAKKIKIRGIYEEGREPEVVKKAKKVIISAPSEAIKTAVGLEFAFGSVASELGGEIASGIVRLPEITGAPEAMTTKEIELRKKTQYELERESIDVKATRIKKQPEQIKFERALGTKETTPQTLKIRVPIHSYARVVGEVVAPLVAYELRGKAISKVVSFGKTSLEKHLSFKYGQEIERAQLSPTEIEIISEDTALVRARELVKKRIPIGKPIKGLKVGNGKTIESIEKKAAKLFGIEERSAIVEYEATVKAIKQGYEDIETVVVPKIIPKEEVIDYDLLTLKEAKKVSAAKEFYKMPEKSFKLSKKEVEVAGGRLYDIERDVSEIPIKELSVRETFPTAIETEKVGFEVSGKIKAREILKGGKLGKEMVKEIEEYQMAKIPKFVEREKTATIEKEAIKIRVPIKYESLGHKAKKMVKIDIAKGELKEKFYPIIAIKKVKGGAVGLTEEGVIEKIVEKGNVKFIAPKLSKEVKNALYVEDYFERVPEKERLTIISERKLGEIRAIKPSDIERTKLEFEKPKIEKRIKIRKAKKVKIRKAKKVSVKAKQYESKTTEIIEKQLLRAKQIRRVAEYEPGEVISKVAMESFEQEVRGYPVSAISGLTYLSGKVNIAKISKKNVKRGVEVKLNKEIGKKELDRIKEVKIDRIKMPKKELKEIKKSAGIDIMKEQEPVIEKIEEVKEQKLVITKPNITKQKQYYVYITKEEETIPRKTPGIPIMKVKKKPKTSRDIEQAYNAYVKSETGKFIKVNRKPMTKKEAINRGAYVVDNTSSATFRIKKSRKKIRKNILDIRSPTTNKFRRKGELFIERKEKRIDTLGEIQGITVRGWLALERKRKIGTNIKNIRGVKLGLV